MIYRVTQESLSNIVQHAGATRVARRPVVHGQTVLKIDDDGAGFAGAAPPSATARLRGRPGGLGLSGMRERALLVGGNLNVFSHPGEGTTIELTMGAR